MRQSREPSARYKIFQRRGITYKQIKQLRAYFIAHFRDVRFWLQLCDIKYQLARERISVGMQPGRRQRDQRITRSDSFSIQYLVAFDDGNDEAGQIVFAR